MQQYPTILAGDRITASLLTSTLPISVIKSADETRISTVTPTNDSEIFLAVEANAIYRVVGFFKYNSDATADFRITWTGPAGATFEYVAVAIDTATTTVNGTVQMATNTIATSRPYGGAGTASNVGMDISGTLRVGSTAGTLQLQWAQGTSQAITTTLKADSWITLERVA